MGVCVCARAHACVSPCSLKIDFAGMGEEGGNRGSKVHREVGVQRVGGGDGAPPQGQAALLPPSQNLPKRRRRVERPADYVAGASLAFIHFVCVTKRSSGEEICETLRRS